MTGDQPKEFCKLDDPEDLAKLYFRTKESVSKSKGRRLLFLRLAFAAVVLIILGNVFDILHPESVSQVAGYILLSYMISAALFWVNFCIFSWFVTKQQEDSAQLELVEKRLHFLSERVAELPHAEMAEMIANRIRFYADSLLCIHHNNPAGISAIWAAILYSVRDRLDDLQIFQSVKRIFLNTAPSPYEDASGIYQSFIDANFDLKTKNGMMAFFALVSKYSGTDLDALDDIGRDTVLSIDFEPFCDVISRAGAYIKYFQDQRGPKYSHFPWES